MEGVNTMKKYLIWTIFIGVVFYFLSSFAFSILGERVVAQLMIIFLIIGTASVIALITILIKERFTN
jgi:hypothetical protein